MSDDVEKAVTISPLSLEVLPVSENCKKDSTHEVTATSDEIICGGVLLPKFITSWTLVKKIRNKARPSTNWSRMLLCVRYIAMAVGRALAIYSICEIHNNSDNCKEVVSGKNDDDGASPSECTGLIITLVVLGVCISSYNDAVWSASFIGLQSSSHRFHFVFEVWLQFEIVLGLMSLYFWYYLLYPLILIVKLALLIFGVTGLGKVWVSMTLMSCASAVMAFVCLLMNIIGKFAPDSVIATKCVLFVVSGLSFVFSFGQLVCMRSSRICWISTSSAE